MKYISSRCIYLLSICVVLFFAGCANIREARPVSTPALENVNPAKIIEKEKTSQLPGPPPFSEIYVPVSKGLKKDIKLFSMALDQAKLGEALATIANEADINMSVDSDIDIARPVTVRLKNLTMEEALDMIVEKGAGYTWKLKDGVLNICRFKEHIYQFDYLDMVGETNIDVGGDMLASGVEGAGVKGKYQVKAKREGKSSDIWAGIAVALEGIKSADGVLKIDANAGIIYMLDTPAKIAAMISLLDSFSETLHRQVFIEAKILEVHLSDDSRYGLDWSKMSAGFRANGGGVIDRNLPDIFDLTVNGSGRLFLSTSSQLSGVLDFIKTQGDISVISNPHISVLNHQSAVLTVGYQFPYGDVDSVDRDQTTGVVTINSKIKRAILGLQLGLTPQISRDGIITLHIVPTITKIQGTQEVQVATGANTVQSISNPIIDLRELATTVRVKDGNTVVLAGLISQIKQLNDAGLPGLGSLPYIKNLFRNMKNLQDNQELVIFITPYIKKI